MVGILLNDTLCYFNKCYSICRLLDYLIGNSIILTILLYICSYLFKFCNWHRLIVTSNLIAITIVIIDNLFYIPISNLKLLLLYYIVYLIFLIIILIYKFKCNEKVSKESIIEGTKVNSRKD